MGSQIVTPSQTLEVSIVGMDCAECTQHVRAAIAALPGVTTVDVFLATEKAVIQIDPARVTLPALQHAVAGTGYSVPPPPTRAAAGTLPDFTRTVLTLLGVIFSIVLLTVVVGEWLGLFEGLTARVPWPLGMLVVGGAGYPVFRNVLQATLRRQVISHTLMSVGVLAALAVGHWATAAGL
jgi:Cd2+/Zn2+-exporting ATPase/Cu+-exporting ATPase